MLGASQRHTLSRSGRDAGRRAGENGPVCARRRARTAQPSRPGAAKLRGRQNNSNLRLNASGKPTETTDRSLLPMIKDGVYPQYTAQHEYGGAGRNQKSLSKKRGEEPKSKA
jgi:hypothetical protein